MLKIHELVKIYPGQVHALRGLSLDLAPGMFGLLGPNGAGKSTLMKILAGLLEPTSGSVSLDGVDVLARPQALWPRLGYLPQDFGLYPNLTGEQMLRFLLELKGVRAPGGLARLTSELLERVNLGQAADRKVKTYSGGMRQRIGIAQAIAGDPRLVIVDEPTAGLDPEERHRFYRLLAGLAEDRMVLLSTHIVEDVARLCPRFAVIREGRLVTLTTPSQALGELEGRVFDGKVSSEALGEVARRFRLIQSVLLAGVHRARIYVPRGEHPEGFEPTRPTLEDAYLLLMKGDAVVREAEVA